MNYTQEQLEDALIKADAAGNTDDARFLAGELHKMRQAANESVMAGDIDFNTGSPAEVRLAVGASPQEDKLATLQQYYPDARIHEDNFVYTDPSTGQQTAYNPKGFDMGDLVEGARIVPEIIGGIGGGVAGAAGGSAVPVVGTTAGGIAGGAVGAELGGQAYDWAMRRLLPIIDNRDVLDQLGDAAINTGINALGGVAGEVAGKILNKFGNTVRTGTGKTNEEVLEAADRVGIEAPLGVVSGNRGIQQAEETLANIPLVSGTIGNKYQKALDDLGEFSLNTSRELTDIEGAFDVGNSLLKGVDDHVAKFKADSSQLYDDLWAAMPADTRVPLPNTTERLQEITTKFADDPAFEDILGSKKLKTFKQAVDSNEQGVTIGTLKALRTQIGSQLENANLIDDTAGAELKQLYSALSDDLAVAAINQGDDAYRAWETANDFYRNGSTIINDVLNPIVKGGVAENVYKRVFGTEGQVIKRPNVEEIKTLMASVPASTRKDIEGEFVRRMGLAGSGSQDVTGEVFSPNTFMTNYNRLSKKAKDEIFSPKSRQALDDVATLAASLKDRAKTANSSGTASPVVGAAVLFDMLGGGGLASASGLAGGQAISSLITNPKFVNWLTRTSENAGSQRHIMRNIGQLYAMADEFPEMRPGILQYLDNLKAMQIEATQPQEREQELPQYMQNNSPLEMSGMEQFIPQGQQVAM